MKKTVLLTTAAVLALSVGGIASAAGPHPTASSAGTHSKGHIFVKPGSLNVLYDQNSNDGGIGIVSQNFESTFDQYDAQAADDFKVPHGSTWKVAEVDVTGVYFNGAGLANSENVVFYRKGSNQLPGEIVREFDGVVGADNGTGSFIITLPHVVRLRPGTYWVSVQANMDFSVGGEWGWENRLDVVRHPAAWVNPGDGFATGCTTYTVETTCIPDGQGDHMFTLKGTSQ